MPNSPKSEFNEIDLTFSVSTPPLGISGVQLRTKRGPFGNTSTIIPTWGQFVRVYGGLMPGVTDGPHLVKRAFERGSKLRINKIGHYTDITNPATLDAVFAAPINSTVLTLSAAMTAGSIDVIINGVTITQPFVTNMAATWASLVQKIFANQTLKQLVAAAAGWTNTIFTLTSKGSSPLTVTASTTGAGGITAASTTKATFDNTLGGSPVTLFAITPKYPGADYNNLVVSILNASNGSSDFFNLRVDHLQEPDIFELYENLYIQGNPSVAVSHYLDKVISGSSLVKVTYNNLNGTTGVQRPANISIKYSGGTDGSALTDSDYIGDSASKLGLHAFTAVDDIMEIATLDNESSAVMIAGSAYAATRKDLQYFVHLPNSTATEQGLISLRDATAIDTKYTMFFAGGLSVTDPQSAAPVNISELGDIIGMAAYSAEKAGPWQSFAGIQRGLILNALGIVNNFGTPGNTTLLNMLCNHGINVVVNSKNRRKLNSCYTGQITDSDYSFGSVTRMVIFMKKTIGPLMENYLEEPNDIITWKKIYQAVQPFLKSMKDKRAISKYDWQGDQFANTFDDLTTNQLADVDQGKYRVNLFMTSIKPLIDIGISIILTPSGVSFEDALAQVQP